MLPNISSEQQRILDNVKKGCNIQVDAVAGSGKTTTSLYIASSQPDKSVLLLTYNARLKMETRQKAASLGLDNLEVHSYHAFCVKYFDPKGYTDAGILRFLDKKPKPCSFGYRVVIIDEAQDMNPLYFRLVCRILQNTEKAQVVVMGDRKQSIYGFNKADPRFLTRSPDIFPNNDREWKQAALSTSYRVTQPMAKFLNECCTGALPVRSVKNGDPVRYIVCSTYGFRPLSEVEFYLRQGYRAEDIFILAPSVKCNRSPVRILANRLTEKGVPIYVPTSDDEKLDDDVLRNKIVFSTFHQVKGLERPIVLVFDFSEQYFRYYGKDLPTDEIPNTVYVAITRAMSRLTVFHDDSTPYFSFLKPFYLPRSCVVEKTKRFKEDRTFSPETMSTTTTTKKDMDVAELMRYVPADVLQRCMEKITVEKITDKSGALDIPLKTKQKDLYESVSEINSVAIPAYFEYTRTKTMTIVDHLRASSGCLLSTPIMTDMTVSRLLQLSTRWVCLKSGYDFKKTQVQEFDWLSEETLRETTARLQTLFLTATTLCFEKRLVDGSFDDQYSLTGFIDVYDAEKNNAWRLKTVSELGQEHFLQTALCLWLLQRNGHAVQNTFLYNIMDNERYRISTEPSFDEAVQELLLYKKSQTHNHSDEEFIHSVKLMMKK
jgi:hypothetical protein